jgi:GDP-mannose 6-dehydrogenase
LQALGSRSLTLGADTPLIAAASASNEAHKRFILSRCTAGVPPGGRILLLGLSFKKGAGDLRGSPHAELARVLVGAGYDLSLHDPSIAASHVADHEPTLAGLLLGREQIEAGTFDRVIDTGGYAASLDLAASQVIDLQRLA